MGMLDGKVVLITGATRGIGRGMAVVLAGEGAQVAFTYASSEEKARELESELGSSAKGFKSDASSFTESGELVDQVIAAYGKIDALVNNAGVTRDNLILRMDDKQWDEVIRTNLNSVFNLTKHTVRHMMKARSGSIINITSLVGMRGNAGQSNYAASKAGIIGFTKSIAKELGSRNIRCNAIAPGFIETEMTDALAENVREEYFKTIPLGRFGTTNEVAQVCLFLASDRASYVNGQVISVCGGMNT
jgi:3-oxoacyl-[acyl-carrier protein] reductase